MRRLQLYLVALSLNLFLLGLAAQAHAQSPIPVGPPPVDISDAPEPGVFLLYFQHLASIDAEANSAEATGNPDAGQWRSYERRMAGLTDAEGAIVKGIAYPCNQALIDHDAEVEAEAAASAEPPAGRMDIVNSAIDDLRSQLGDESFQKLALRAQALYGNVAILQTNPPGPLPPSYQTGSGDLGPPVPADATLPHTDVFSGIFKLDEHTFLAECYTAPQDDLTTYYYPGAASFCQMYPYPSGAAININCNTSFGPAACTSTFSNVPGQTFYVRAVHALQMYIRFCTTETGETYDCLKDTLHYGSPPGTQLPDFQDGARIFAPGGPEAYWPTTFPNNTWIIAGTHSTPVAFINIGPRQVSLLPNQQQQFASNIPTRWYNYGPGKIDAYGLYKAPASVTSQQTDTIEGCDANPEFYPYLVDCVRATVTLQPLSVDVSPASAEVLPGTQRSFTAVVTPTTAAQPVTWSLVDPTNAATITPLSVTNALAANFKAPPVSQISATQEITVKACMTPSGSSQAVCGTAKVLVPKLQIFIAAPTHTLKLGETVQLTAVVNGSSLPWQVDWEVTPEIPDAQLTVITPDTLVATYKASPTQKSAIFIRVCLHGFGDFCSENYVLDIVDPIQVRIDSITSNFNAGELASPFTIAGAGFGTHPTVAFENLQATVTSASDTSISGVAVVPVATGGGSTRAAVTVRASNGDEATVFYPVGSRIPIAPVSLLSVVPTTAEAHAGGTQPFTAICLTAKGAACSSPETVRWSASPGTIAPPTGPSATYTAPASVTSNTTATVSACWNGTTFCAPAAHVTLLPADVVSVTVSPKTATVPTGQTQAFSAQVSGSTNTGVTWSLQPSTAEAGSISPTGVYSAPASLGSVTTVTVTATSQADATKKDTATVTLVGPVTSFTCTPSPASANYGTLLTWTATVSGGAPPFQYALFRRRAGTTAWTPDATAPAWQSSNVLSWTPLVADAGVWEITLWVKDAYTPPNSHAASCNPGSVTVAAPLAVTGTASPAYATSGTAITWTATASGGIPASTQYALFRLKSGTTAWIPDVTAPAWQSSNVLSWTPTAADAGTWTIIIWVRDGNTPPSMNGYGYAGYYNAGPVQVVAPLSVTGTSSPAYATSGTAITWTATASGGIPASTQYALFRLKSGTTAWIPDVTAPAWQSSNVLSWTPTAADTGTWTIIIWVRDGNTPPNMNGYGYAGYYNAGAVQVVAPLSVTGTGSPQYATAGTALTWTVTASGGTPATTQFAFFRRRAGTTAWTPDITTPAWQASNVLSWTPASADAGTWETYVWVKDGTTPATMNTYGYAAGYNPGPVQVTAPLAVTGTGSPGSATYDTAITWTAYASGGIPASTQYAFFRRRLGTSAWTPAVTAPAWQAGNVLSWTPTSSDVGTWETYIWVKDGSTPSNMNTYGYAAGYNPGWVQVVAPLSVTGTGSPGSVNYGNPITWTAYASGGTPSTTQYAFFRRLAGTANWIPSVWSPAWQGSNVLGWTPTSADVGTWETYVWVRDGNTPANMNTYGYAAGYNPGPVQITAPPPPPTVTGTGSPSSANAGTTINWTAYASGGTPGTFQYAFFRRLSGTANWLPDVWSPAWQSGNVLSWTPSSADIGTWEIIIWIRDGNTPANMNTYGYSGYYNAGPVQIVNPVSQSYAPTGWVDGYNSQHVWGWACDPDYPTQSNRVDIWSSNWQQFFGSVDASGGSSAAINSACGGGWAHYFDFYPYGGIPSGTHIMVWSIDLPYSTPGNDNRPISGSGAGGGIEFVIP